jgi:hypothetical protein
VLSRNTAVQHAIFFCQGWSNTSGLKMAHLSPRRRSASSAPRWHQGSPQAQAHRAMRQASLTLGRWSCISATPFLFVPFLSSHHWPGQEHRRTLVVTSTHGIRTSLIASTLQLVWHANRSMLQPAGAESMVVANMRMRISSTTNCIHNCFCKINDRGGPPSNLGLATLRL